MDQNSPPIGTLDKPPVSESADWPEIRALKLAISVRWQRPNVIPPQVLANILRGGLGITLRQLACPKEWQDNPCPPCPLYRDCPYGQVFSPSPPADAHQLRLQQDLPRPFVIDPLRQDQDQPTDPTGITFHLMLFGAAVFRFPIFVSTLERLGHAGLGRDRMPFQLQSITANHPAGSQVLFVGGNPRMTLPDRQISTGDLLGTEPLVEKGTTPPGSAANPARCRIRYLTPTVLKAGSGLDAQGNQIPAQEIRDRPPLGVLIRRLRDRLSALSAFFGTPWNHPDFASLGQLADEVRLVDAQTAWETRRRHSTRTGHKHELSGFVGEADYEFPTTDHYAQLWPLLRFGELIHVGKHAAWGNGAIQVTRLEGRR